ncbi:MAG TPA: aminoacyl-tRNA hydrolase [Patescibacteria group bacterium]|nr:aminoacyl-tRNA hydrolase [Patescibacteria group bacterium]
MKLLVGLGNPGDKYEATRHNLGFMVAEQFLKDYEPVRKTTWSRDEKMKSDIVMLDWQPEHGETERVILAKPLTYMNNSGMAVNLLSLYYKIKPEDIWIIHDELDLPFGTMKIRSGGAAAGHHGVESIISSLGTDKFWRFRLGIGVTRDKEEVAHHIMKNVDEYVLGSFSQEQEGRLRELINHAAKALQFTLENDTKSAMNRYNTK